MSYQLVAEKKKNWSNKSHREERMDGVIIYYFFNRIKVISERLKGGHERPRLRLKRVLKCEMCEDHLHRLILDFALYPKVLIVTLIYVLVW